MSWKHKGFDPSQIASRVLEGHSLRPSPIPLEVDLVQAGADALLEALKKEAIYHTPPTTKIGFPLMALSYFKKGWLIFIEEEEEKDEA